VQVSKAAALRRRAQIADAGRSWSNDSVSVRSADWIVGGVKAAYSRLVGV